jgi:hypothetical protein
MNTFETCACYQRAAKVLNMPRNQLGSIMGLFCGCIKVVSVSDVPAVLLQLQESSCLTFHLWYTRDNRQGVPQQRAVKRFVGRCFQRTRGARDMT